MQLNLERWFRTTLYNQSLCVLFLYLRDLVLSGLYKIRVNEGDFSFFIDSNLFMLIRRVI
jgi:hypothetical protein